MDTALVGWTQQIRSAETTLAKTQLAQGQGTFAESLIEYAGRVCYASEPKMGHGADFIGARLREGHEDIIEHGWCSVLADTNLASIQRPTTPYLAVAQTLGGVLVSGNLRAWRQAFKAGELDWAWQHAVRVAPSIFAVDASGETFPPAPPTPQAFIANVPIPTTRVELLGAQYITDLPWLKPLVVGDNLQHGSATFVLSGVSRALTHQLVRHRLGSFCLAGDTIVPAFRKNNKYHGKKWTMRQLWEWQNDPARSSRLRLIRLRGINERGELIPVQIKSVINSGYQQLYRITTESGRVVRSTINHSFLTTTGWKSLGELAIGDKVLSNGIPAYQNREYLQQRYLVENTERAVLAKEIGVSDACLGVWIRKFGLQKPKTQYPGRKPGYGKPGMFSLEQKKLLGDQKRGEQNPQWKGDAVGVSGGYMRSWKTFSTTVCARCGKTDYLERHHKDRNPTNNNPDNIIVLCMPCHKAEHFGMVTMTVFPDSIVAIEIDQFEETFDIEILDDCHNFVANGIVVHNSQQSQRYADMDRADIQLVIPPAIRDNPQAERLLSNFWSHTRSTYNVLREMGIRKEDARFLLPNAATTKIVVTMSFAGWQHFVWLRALDKAAQWEIRGVAQEILRNLYAVAPKLFEKEWQTFINNRASLKVEEW